MLTGGFNSPIPTMKGEVKNSISPKSTNITSLKSSEGRDVLERCIGEWMGRARRKLRWRYLTKGRLRMRRILARKDWGKGWLKMSRKLWKRSLLKMYSNVMTFSKIGISKSWLSNTVTVVHCMIYCRREEEGFLKMRLWSCSNKWSMELLIFTSRRLSTEISNYKTSSFITGSAKSQTLGFQRFWKSIMRTRQWKTLF